jgi:hypothetical protein
MNRNEVREPSNERADTLVAPSAHVAPMNDDANTRAVRFFVANGAGLFGLWLLSQSGPASTARAALQELAQRVLERVRRALDAADIAPAIGADEHTAWVQMASSMVMAALNTCRTRRPESFARWMDQHIEVALNNSRPASTSNARVLPFARPLATTAPLPMPVDNTARLAAVLRALPWAERRVLELRSQNASNSWSAIAQRLGLSVSATRALHESALTHAREQALAQLVDQRHSGYANDAPRSA